MEIRIVEYDAGYAAGVADMWNHSRDGWGGANTVDTEETILHREASSTNIHTYLALEGDLVVGYCGLSEYREDEGALYIPLLNVRDDYHGRKIGKKMLLKAIEKTIELGWPRLDLYTWPGNTKAVPLYKKCGFFWEERDDSTHLMNFIPTVLQTEAVQDYFQHAEWYESSNREIEVKPDGRVENDFHFYTYTWEKNNQMLKMEFERTGRGIRLIETDDYYISAEVPEHKLVFGVQYEIHYSIKNKSGEPLHIELQGKSDKNITFILDESLEVTGETKMSGSFHVLPIDEEQNKERTHPSVQTTVKINGKEAIFKTGILPKFPAQVTAKFSEDLTFSGKENIFYLDLMNNFSEKVRFKMNFPASPLLEMAQQNLEVEMEAKERKSVALPFTVKAFGYYSANLDILAFKASGEDVSFSKHIGIPLRGIGAKFSGENEDSLQLYNGQYFAALEKQGNTIYTGRKVQDIAIAILKPKVGKPYTEEMTRASFEKIAYFEGTGYIGAKLTYPIKAFPSLKLHVFLKLYGEGIFENYYEIENVSDEETEQPVWMNQSAILELDRAVLPYQGEIVAMNDSIGNSYEYWDDGKLSENWLFVNDDKNPIGITWDKTEKVHFESYYLYFEHNLGQIHAKSFIQSKPVTFSIGAFPLVESFREFATQSVAEGKVKPVNHLRLALEGNNPFVQGETLKAKVTDYKSNYLHGELKLGLASDSDHAVIQSFDRAEEKTAFVKEISFSDPREVSTVKFIARLDAAEQERETLVIRCKENGFDEKVIQEHGLDVWQLNNGVIELKAAPAFYPAVHSLTYKGEEWLDASFPTLEPKLWWNPWSGGISGRLSATRTHSLSKEKTVAAFAGLTDSKGNRWRGIKLSTSIEHNEEYKAFTFHQYFLLLPGAPVLCHVTEIEQDTGKFFNGNDWQSTAFFKPGEGIDENWVGMQNEAGEWTKVIAGKDENDLEVAGNMLVGCENKAYHLQYISDTSNTNRMGYVNKQVVMTGTREQLTMPSGSKQFTIPNFYLFHDRAIPDYAQHDLQAIRF